MTQKEKLYLQLLIASNEYAELKSLPTVDIEAMNDGCEFSANAKKYTIAQLNSEIEAMKDKIERTKAEKAREEYWATPAGAKRKAEIEQKLQELEEIAKEARVRYMNQAISILRQVLGERWIIRSTSASQFSIQLTDAMDKPIFGHDFDIRYDEFKKQIRINMGTLGGFDPINNQDRVYLYTTFGTLVSNTALLQELTGTMAEWEGFANSSSEEYYNVAKELKNPTI